MIPTWQRSFGVSNYTKSMPIQNHRAILLDKNPYQKFEDSYIVLSVILAINGFMISNSCFMLVIRKIFYFDFMFNVFDMVTHFLKALFRRKVNKARVILSAFLLRFFVVINKYR